MRTGTPCPDLPSLRLFLSQPSSGLDSERARSHLAECQICRAIAEGLEEGDGLAATLARENEATEGTQGVAANALPSGPSNTEGMRTSASCVAAGLYEGLAVDGLTLPFSESSLGADPVGPEIPAATCFFVSEVDSRASQGFDPATQVSPDGDGRNTAHERA